MYVRTAYGVVNRKYSKLRTGTVPYYLLVIKLLGLNYGTVFSLR